MSDCLLEAVVEFPYTAQENDELTLKKGDIIKNIKTQPGGWWEGNLGTQRGMFPDNFVRVINDSSKTKTDGVTLRPGGSRRKCRVLFSYQPVNDDELQLLPDDVIDVLEEVEEGWWKGKLKDRIGVFPSNFVSEIASTDPSRSPGHREQREILAASRNEDAASPSASSTVTGPGASFNDNNMTTSIVEDAPSLPPKPVKETCLALFPYEAANDDELTLKEGDIIVLLSREVADKGWWRGELRGRIGVFPDNFVEVIPIEETSKKPERPTSKPGLHTTNKVRDSITKTAAAAAAASTVTTTGTTTTTSPSTITTPLPLISSTTTSTTTTTSNSNSSSLETKGQAAPPPPLLGKKPILPPPPTTKKPHRTTTSTSSSGPKRESSETAEGPGPTKTARGASDLTDGAVMSIARARSSDSSNRTWLGEFDIVERHAMLTQPIRERGPRRRPPKGGASATVPITSVTPTSNVFGLSPELTNGTTEDASMEEDTTDEPEQSQPVKRDPSWKTPSPQQQQQAPWVEELKMNQARKSQSPKGPITTPSPPTVAAVRGRQQPPSTSPLSSAAEGPVPVSATRPRSLYEPSTTITANSTSPATTNKPRTPLVTNTSSNNVTQTANASNHNQFIHPSRNSIDLHALTSQMQSLSTSNTNPEQLGVSSTSNTSGRQPQELIEKVKSLEQLIDIQRETFQKAIAELSTRLQEEVEHRVALQREVDKLSKLVTQV